MKQKLTHPTKEQLQLARDTYCSTEVEIDDNARAIQTDEGTWIVAWVWLPKPEEEITVRPPTSQDIAIANRNALIALGANYDDRT